MFFRFFVRISLVAADSLDNEDVLSSVDSAAISPGDGVSLKSIALALANRINAFVGSETFTGEEVLELIGKFFRQERSHGG